MANLLAAKMQELTAMQRKVVEWNDGPLLVLAGPGSGKTRVLTCRVARLLEESSDKRFRILALTFTDKAAYEMKNRVATLVAGDEERAEFKTFHGFCAQILRQHGVHIGLKPHFEIFSRTVDREAVLEDALQRRTHRFEHSGINFLPQIDALKARLVEPDQATEYLRDHNGVTPEMVEPISEAYHLYEEELHRANALDFNSLIFKTFELLKHPELTQLYQTIYRYWMIDEFQDTNTPQYALLRRMAGDKFRQLFAIADDTQTTYEWNGTNVSRLRGFVDHFDCEVIQLTDNSQCPPRIVEAANRLAVYNARRNSIEQISGPANLNQCTNENEIRSFVFPTDSDEAIGIAKLIADLSPLERENAAVLARNRSVLQSVKARLEDLKISSSLLGRRDDFASPQMRWLLACLKQINRPLDSRNMAALIESFGNFTNCVIYSEELITRSETENVTLLTAWVDAVRGAACSDTSAVETIAEATKGNLSFHRAIEHITKNFASSQADENLKEDLSAWRRMEREIRQARGTIALDQFLQELELRSKEPAAIPGSVSLATIHGAKGLEFDRVYLIGLAEGVLPSWQSVNNGDESRALEEERRGCFVAITRTRQRLILSRARSYRGVPKKPSRFLSEMGLHDSSLM